MNPWIAAPIAGFALFALNEVANPRFAFLGKVFHRGDPAGVALTFDDGPHPEHTPRVLEILERFQARASFFVIGRQVRENGPLVAEAARAGHVIGNHSYGHMRWMSLSSADKIRQEVLRCQDEVEKWIGYRPRFYRQPAGFRNPRIFAILRELGMTLVSWQVRAFDTQVKNPEAIARSILTRVKPGGVILLHDGADSETNDDRSATLRALPQILQGIKERGLRFCSLEELLGLSKEIHRP